MKSKDQLTKEVEQVLDVVREGLARHRGGVDVVDVDETTGQVFVKMKGMCVGCPMADMTVKMNIEDTLRSLVPEVTEVVPVETHDEA